MVWGASPIPLALRLPPFRTRQELRFACWCRKQRVNSLKRFVPILSRSGRYNPAMATSSPAGSKHVVGERCVEDVRLGPASYEFAAGPTPLGLETRKSRWRRSTARRWILLYRSGNWNGRSDETIRSR